MSPGPPAPGLVTSGAANTFLGSLPRPSKGRFPKFAKTKKNKKKIFMDSCEGHLKELYEVIGRELDKVIDEPERGTLDEMRARNSDEEGQSTEGESAESNSMAKRWKLEGRLWKAHEVLQGDPTPQAPKASVSAGPTNPDELASEVIGEMKNLGDWFQEELSPERNARPGDKIPGEADVDERTKAPTTPVKIDLHLIAHIEQEDLETLPLTIDPVSNQPVALPLNATW